MLIPILSLVSFLKPAKRASLAMSGAPFGLLIQPLDVGRRSVRSGLKPLRSPNEPAHNLFKVFSIPRCGKFSIIVSSLPA